MKIKCLLVMPGKEVQKIKIPGNIKFIKSFLGRNLQKISLDKNNVIYISQNADYTEYNRLFRDGILIGSFLVVSTKNGRKVSMKKRDLRKYTNMFKLAKHEKKIERFKDEFLEEFYSNQRKIKEKNRQHNRENLFKNVA